MAHYPGNTPQQMHETLTDAFEASSMARMLRFRMGLKWHLLVPNDSFETQVFELLQQIEYRGLEEALIEAAYRERPGNRKVKEMYERAGLASAVNVQKEGAADPAAAAVATVSDAGLEKIVKAKLGFVDIDTWSKKLSEITGQVCRITISDNAAGTGFLIGADRVLTNYHVLESVIEGRQKADDVRCEFDYHMTPAGTRKIGPSVKLHPGGKDAVILAFSPYTPDEKAGQPDRSVPGPDQLDFALLRLAEPVGDQPAESMADPSTNVPRGWIAFPGQAPNLTPGDPLIIAQHPDGMPMKLAIDTQAVLSVNQAGNRVRYATNTDSGSSGSPCFDFNWNLVALHHYGDPAYGHPRYNQGVLAESIRQWLASKGLI